MEWWNAFNEKFTIMKKLCLIILLVLSLTIWADAQTVDDALRYSQIFYSGTSRFSSMGGAFTALGGDLSTLSQNPAGIGLFRSSEVSITPQLFHINTLANFKTKSLRIIFTTLIYLSWDLWLTLLIKIREQV